MQSKLAATLETYVLEHTHIPQGIVTGRGCSTKDKVFFKECETHSYGDTVEKMCFCSFFLCNGAAISICPNILLITVLATLMSVHHLFLNESSNININTTTGTNSWPFWGGDLRPKRQMVHVVSVAASDSHSQAILASETVSGSGWDNQPNRGVECIMGGLWIKPHPSTGAQCSLLTTSDDNSAETKNLSQMDFRTHLYPGFELIGSDLVSAAFYYE
ncbi:hypothetical protein TCAL_14869 [Tigriopus californicus]|uniref:Uncharacterized protein n=1 Tax=Tigriopus californicus TaxID=6832 RepID=A0A553P4E3_TIGCA|nr:hypothetical protein TCAL_14869 [Tigriopus californicus]